MFIPHASLVPRVQACEDNFAFAALRVTLAFICCVSQFNLVFYESA